MIPPARILGTGSYVPPRVVTNDDLREVYGLDTDDAWIRTRTGIGARRFADEGVAPSDLAVEAARRALDSAGMAPTEIDLVVLCTLSPDRAFPGASSYLQAKLGLPEAGAFPGCLDVRAQCSGFLYGLAVASSMVRAGGARRVLLVGAEVHSAALDLTTRGRAVASLFGDGAGAVVLGSDADRPGLEVAHVRLGADGRYADELSQAVWDMSRRPYIALDGEGFGRVPPEDLYARMNGRLVFKHAVERMSEVLLGALEHERLTLADVSLFLFHQANLRINHAVADRLGIPADKVPSNIERYGNTTAATIPLLLDEALRAGRVRDGDVLACASFGSGFTWAGAVLKQVG